MMGNALYGEAAPEQAESYLAAIESFLKIPRNPKKITVVSNTFCFGSARYLDPWQTCSILSRYERQKPD